MTKRIFLRFLAVLMLIGSAITWYFMYNEWSLFGDSWEYEIGIGGVFATLLFVVLFVIQTATCILVLSKNIKPNVPKVIKNASRIMFLLNLAFFILIVFEEAKNEGPEGSGSAGFGNTIALPALLGVIIKLLFLSAAARYYKSISRAN